MNEKELAEARELIQSVIDRWDYDISKTTLEKVDQILNTPITIEGGVCLECKGTGAGSLVEVERHGVPHPDYDACPTCNGTGKLDKTFTIKQCIEDYKRREG